MEENRATANLQEEEEDDETGFSDAVQEMENNNAKTQEQNMEPEADQLKTAVVTEDDGVEFREDAGRGDEVSTLPGDDAGKELTSIADESQGDLRAEFAAIILDDSKDFTEAESGAVAASGNISAAEDDVEGGVTPSDTKEMLEDVLPEGQALMMDESGDAPVVAKEADAESNAAEKDMVNDANESFETARGDISNITSPGGGDTSLYASMSTISVGSGDLDSTLECDKTLDLSESTESGTGSGKGYGEVNGGGGDAQTLSPPRCDSGIMEDKEGGEDVVKISQKESSVMSEAGIVDGTITNGTD